MQESEFRTRADAIYKAVLARLDAEDPDEVEGEMSAGVVKIRCKNGQVYVLNIQPPLREVWYAAGDRAWHFQRQDDGRWVDPRNGDDLEGTLGRTISAAIGREVAFRMPR